MREIYLIYDRQIGGVRSATTDKTAALAEIERLNSKQRASRYVLCTHKDFAVK